MKIRSSVTAIALSIGVSLLAACDSAEERAEKHYQTGLSYLESGDVDRALVEFRNVFKLNGTHREARVAYAEAESKRGNTREAFAQYLRLAEQYPDDPDAMRSLAELAAQAGDWKTAKQYADQLLAKIPDDTAIQAVQIAAAYGIATTSNDVDGTIAAATKAHDLLQIDPGNMILRRVVIDDLVRAQKYDAALAEIDTAIRIAPEDRALYTIRLQVNAALGDMKAVEDGLINMVQVFPDAPEMSEALVRWYVSRKELDKAETFLRDQLVTAKDKEEAKLALVRFLAQDRGIAAAVEELDRLIASGETSSVLRSARAGFIFDLGRQDEAIEETKELLKSAEPSDDTRRIKIGLARMMSTVGNDVGAQALVEEVIEEDGGNNEALKLKATWLIRDDQVGDAIAILRRAHDQNPRDADVLTLMAQAYERDGNRDLMRDSLSLAVEASGRAPGESLRYAQFLAGENKLLPAESVLIDALRMAPGNLALLQPLGQIYVSVQDWARAEAVAAELEALEDPNAKTSAQQLRTAILAGQNNSDIAVSYLQDLVSKGEGGMDAKLAILQTNLANREVDQALAYSENLLKEDPQNPDLRFINASVRAYAGDVAGAEAEFRALTTENGKLVPAWLALARTMMTDEARAPEAAKAVEAGLAANPDSAELKWAKAGFLERAHDIDGAIAVYEELYKENSGNPIIANNLASLLSSYRTDPDSLKRAEVIARRLKGSNQPAYQDTYGWIAYQIGNYSDAVKELEGAVEGLGNDPMVRNHLARTYEAVGRKSDALVQYRAALGLVSSDDTRAFIAEMREKVKQFETEGVSPGN